MIVQATGADVGHIGAEMISRGVTVALGVDIETARSFTLKFFADVAAAAKPQAQPESNVVSLRPANENAH
jgi:hypothetical protein